MSILSGEVYKEKGSRFLGFIAPIKTGDDFKTILAHIKKEHKGAKHICYAYAISDGQLYTKFSGDGEPSGVGSALLSLLQHKNLTNCALLVARYFGGVKLGSGNLIRAYMTAGKNAIGLL